MTPKRPRAYFDHKAGIAKVEGRHRKMRCNEISDSGVEFEWNANSHQSWESFVKQWEQRHVQS